MVDIDLREGHLYAHTIFYIFLKNSLIVCSFLIIIELDVIVIKFVDINYSKLLLTVLKVIKLIKLTNLDDFTNYTTYFHKIKCNTMFSLNLVFNNNVKNISTLKNKKFS